MPGDEPKTDAPRLTGMSKTAIWVAAARAIGAREPDPAVRNPDVLAEALLGDPAKLTLDHPTVDALSIGYDEAMQNIEVADTVRAMIERTRFIDEALERAIAAGATQLLIPGAGLDSHAYRCQALLAEVAVFEVDRAATLEFKQQRVNEVLGGPPENLTYVPVDFQREKLPVLLQQHGYDLSKRTFVIMEGVTMYLPEDALRETFQFVAAHVPGSSIVFDFASQAMVESFKRIDLANVPPVARPSVERLLNMLKDEPWLSGLPIGNEREFLAQFGLELGELLTLGSEESNQRYLTRADGTMVGSEAHAKAMALREAAEAYAIANMSAEDRRAQQERMREQRQNMAYRIVEAVVASHRAAGSEPV
jgi:methyltransferase (TIGR00027 family)